MMTTEIIRRRVASLLKDTETLPPLERLPAMDPAEQSEAMTAAWDLRHRAFDLSTDLVSETLNAPKNNSLAEVAQYSLELYDRLKRYDRCTVELLALSRRPITICAADLQSAVDAVCEQTVPMIRDSQIKGPLL